MIIGELNTINQYKGLIPCVTDITKYVQNSFFEPFGQWKLLSENLKVIRLNDWNKDNQFFETHDKFYDLHFTIKGSDRLKVCIGFKNLKLHSAYSVENDYSLYEGRENAEITLGETNWAFILPNEPHRNEFAEEGTEKLVFKILCNNGKGR
jgi:YhcH/YjgK/YiaL family protein